MDFGTSGAPQKSAAPRKTMTDQEFGRQYGSTLGMCINIVANMNENNKYIIDGDEDAVGSDVMVLFKRVLKIQKKAKKFLEEGN